MVGLVIPQLGETFSCKRTDFFPAPIFTAMVTFAEPQPSEHCVCMNKVKTALVVIKMSTLACYCLPQCL